MEQFLFPGFFLGNPGTGRIFRDLITVCQQIVQAAAAAFSGTARISAGTAATPGNGYAIGKVIKTRGPAANSAGWFPV